MGMCGAAACDFGGHCDYLVRIMQLLPWERLIRKAGGNHLMGLDWPTRFPLGLG